MVATGAFVERRKFPIFGEALQSVTTCFLCPNFDSEMLLLKLVIADS